MKRALLFLLLTGCASTSMYPEPEDLIGTLRATYIGQDASYVRARFGPPASWFTGPDGRKVVEWGQATTATYSEPVRTSTTGSIGDPLWGTVPYRQTSTSSRDVQEGYECVMQVALEPDGTVHNIGLVGKMGACYRFMP